MLSILHTSAFCAQIKHFVKMILFGRISLIVVKIKTQKMTKLFHKMYRNLVGETYTFVYAIPPYLVMKSYAPFSKRPFLDVHSPDKFSDHDIVSGTLKMFIPPIKKPRRKVYLYQKGDYESMRKDTQWSLGYSFSTGEL